MQAVMTPDRGQLLVGKNRNPFAVIFFSIITLGIYFYVWVYKVNNEIRAHEPLIRCSPGVSVLAHFIPIANLVSDYNLAARIQRMELADEQPNQISPVVSLVLLFLFGIGYFFQVQGHLNSHWDGHRFAAQRAGLQGGQQTTLGAVPAPAATFVPALTPAEPVAAAIAPPAPLPVLESELPTAL